MTSSSDKPKKKAGLGGIFGNVKRTKKLADKQAEKKAWRRSVTLTCPSCGGPQEVTIGEETRCTYCDEPIAAPDDGGDDG